MISDTGPIARLVHQRLALARASWLILCALFLAAFVVCEWFLYHELQHPCRSPNCADDGFYLTAAEIVSLRALGFDARFYAAIQVGFYVIFCLVNLALGALLFWRRFDDPWARSVGLMLALMGLTFTDLPQTLWSAAPAAATLLQTGGVLAGMALYAFCFSFPNGRFVPAWLRWVAVAVMLLPLVLELLNSVLRRPDLAAALQPLAFAAFVVTALVTQTLRYHFASTFGERQQTRWVVFGIVVALCWVSLVGIAQAFIPGLKQGALNKLLFTGLIYAGFLLVPVSIALAVLRSRLWDIDILISRTLAYGALTACVVALYALIVGYLSTFFPVEGNMLVAIIATGVVAVLFQPLRSWLQRGVNRLIYGERDDPYIALARLGQRLEATLTPEATLPTIAETVALALRLPYVAITIDDGRGVPVAVYGHAPSDGSLCHHIALFYQGATVGRLTLAPRPGERELGPADQRLLSDLARQVGVAAHTVRLAADLRRSREAVVAAREEERRRLRRDLHDGLGPVLATLVVQVEAARELLAEDSASADSLLADVIVQAQGAIADVRHLVYALRPPALDDLGLVGAIRAHASRAAPVGLSLLVDAPQQLPPLPAAVEVAAYRIVQEALTNVLRHARARACRVTLTVVGLDDSQALMVEVCDDGIGLPPGHTGGVGLHAMHERAAEVGGTCRVERTNSGGTVVSACLPLASALPGS